MYKGDSKIKILKMGDNRISIHISGYVSFIGGDSIVFLWWKALFPEKSLSSLMILPNNQFHLGNEASI